MARKIIVNLKRRAGGKGGSRPAAPKTRSVRTQNAGVPRAQKIGLPSGKTRTIRGAKVGNRKIGVAATTRLTKVLQQRNVARGIGGAGRSFTAGVGLRSGAGGAKG